MHVYVLRGAELAHQDADGCCPPPAPSSLLPCSLELLPAGQREDWAAHWGWRRGGIKQNILTYWQIKTAFKGAQDDILGVQNYSILPAFQSCISHFLQQLAWFVSLVALWLIPTGLYPQHDYELLEVKNPTPCLCTLTFEWVHDKLLSSWNYVTWSLSWQIWQTRGVIFSLFWLHHTDWIEPGPWQWKPKILTIRPEGTLAVHFKWRHLLL